MSDVLTVIQGVVFVTYVVYIYMRYGITHSISQSYYSLKEKGYLFTLFCFGIGVPMLFRNDALFYLSGAGLILVGMASSFKDKITVVAHYVGAVIGITASLVGIGVYSNNWSPLVSVGIISLLIILTGIKNHIYWIEITSFLAIIIGLSIL